MKTLPPNYRISSIGLTTDGTIWVEYYGIVPEQGGFHYGWNSIGFTSINDVVSFIGNYLTDNLTKFTQVIAKKEKL